MNTNRSALLLLIAFTFAASCSKNEDKKEVSAAPVQAEKPAVDTDGAKSTPIAPQGKLPKHPPLPKPRPHFAGAPKPNPIPKPSPKPEPNPAPVPDPSPNIVEGLGTPAWGGGGRRAWTSAVRQVVAARFGDFDHARDKESFCPGYSKANPAERVNCFVMIVAAVSKFESNFHTSDSFREPDGNYSIGLLALSPNECPNARTNSALGNPVQNLICGTNMMAKLIRRDGYIDGPDGGRGAASYWSTLRTPYKRWDASRKRYLNLGYKNRILPLVRDFRGHRGRNGLVLNENLFESAMAEEEIIDREEKEYQELYDDRDFYDIR